MGQDDSLVKPTFVKRSKPRGSAAVGGLSASSAASTPSRIGSGRVSLQAETGEDDDDAGVVRRGNAAKKVKGNTASVKERSEKRKSQSLRFVGDQSEVAEDAFELRSSAKASSSRLDPAPPVSLDQASLYDPQPSSLSSAYSSDALAALKASTPSTRVMEEMQTIVDDDGNPVMIFDDVGEEDVSLSRDAGQLAGPSKQAFRTIPDPMDHGDSRLRFGAGHLDEGQGLVPSQSVIEAAKERRRKAAAGNEIGPDDFIPVNETALTKGSTSSSQVRRYGSNSADLGPHPESNLQREEDEVGSGEDEFAEFTGATDRIAIDVKSRKKEEARRRKEQAEMVFDASEDEEQSDDEFERAQLSRMGMPGQRRQKENRETSPYRPAPLPPISPLPSMSATSTRLAARLADLEQSQNAHTAVIEDAKRSLAQLDQDEVENKGEVEVWGEKEAWVRELATFIESLSGLLEEKFPILESIEEDFILLLSERAAIIQRNRAKVMEDELSLFFGVPAICLLPAQVVAETRDIDSSMRVDGEDDAARPTEEWDPSIDGAATSEVRSHRREAGPIPANQAILERSALSPADLAAFERALEPLKKRAESLMSNVEATDFQSPNAIITSPSGQTRPHPSSVHSRFSSWRKRYPDDYNGAWGGLALASIWEFWTRKELALWDCLHRSASDGNAGPGDIESSQSLAALQHYVEDALEGGSDAMLGGDDEAVNTLVNTVFVPRLMAVAEKGAYDPWSTFETQRAILLARQIGDFVDRKGIRFQSLVSAFLKPFQDHILRLDEALSTPPAIPPPGFHPLSIPARLSFATRLLSPPQTGPSSPSGLLFNLLKWNPLVTGDQPRRRYEEIVDVLVSKMGWELLRAAGEQGGARLAGQIVAALPPNPPIQADVLCRLRSLSANTSGASI